MADDFTTALQNALGPFAGQTAGVQSGLQQQALSQQMQQFMLALQFQQQQAALQQAMNLGTQFGSAPGGNWSTWPTPQSMQPLPGTPTQSMQNQYLQQALAAAGLTGQFTNTSQFMYQPGTFVRNRDDGGIGQVQANGSLRTFGSMQEYLAAGGTQQAVNQMPQLSAAEFGNLTNTNVQTPQNTMAASALTGMYQGAPTTAYQQQLAQQAAQGGALTGTYYNQAAMPYQPGTFVKNSETGGIGQVQQNGQIRPFGSMDEYLQAGGTRDQLAGMAPLTNSQWDPLVAAPPSGAAQQTLASQLQNAQLTGLYQGSPTAAYQAQGQQEAQAWAQLYGYTPQLDANGQPIMPGAGGAGGTGTGANPQTLASQLQAAQLSGMYNGAPTETAREFNAQNALAQGQLGQQYLATAAQLQGPQNTFQLSNYMRGAQGNPNVPVYLQNLANNTGTAAFQASGSTAPTPNSIGGLQSQMGGANQNYYTGQQGAGGTNPGWDYNSTLNSINSIAQRGAQGLAPGSLERLSPDELAAFGSGLGAAGYSLPSFLNQYQNSRVGQQAPSGVMSLA
jgi:hypothetical protein